MNMELRTALVGEVARQCEGRADLLEAVVPKYPIGGKRSLRDNGVWIAALRRDNVTLVETPIARIAERGIVTSDGRETPADVIIYGTGFAASDFLSTYKVWGRGGISLHERWQGDARAYLGMTVPGFPNFFMLYGPNTNIVVNGSIIFFSECSVRYICSALALLGEEQARTIEVRADVHDAFNVRIDAENARMAWGQPDVSSWYKNSAGRVSQNWPFALVDYWQATKAPARGDFVID
jgi:4-hydroxyacetophenone monooxygenase